MIQLARRRPQEEVEWKWVRNAQSAFKRESVHSIGIGRVEFWERASRGGGVANQRGGEEWRRGKGDEMGINQEPCLPGVR